MNFKKLSKKGKETNSVLKRGTVHDFKSNKNSSIRTKIAARLMKQKLKETHIVKSNRIISRTIREKNKTLQKLTNVLPGCNCLQHEYLNKHTTFFTNVSKKMFRDNYSDLLFKLKLKLKVKLVNKLKIINDLAGAKLMEDLNVPVFILCPREKVLCNTGTSHIDVNCLSTLLLKYNKINLRGKKCTGLAKNYTTLGAHCNRYGKGFIFSNIHPEYLLEYKHANVEKSI